MLVYIGTYTRGESKGIYLYRLNPDTGELGPAGEPVAAVNPSFLVLHPNGRTLYAVTEAGRWQGKPTGAVAAFARDAATGALTPLNQQESHGRSPCHLGVDAAGKCLLVANYGTGTVAVLPIAADGSLRPASHTVQHEGSSAHPKRQRGPHAHSFTIAPDSRFAFAADLGIDKLMIYQLDAEAGRLTPNPACPHAALAPGAGPRHFAFHPSARYAYVINELDSTVTAFSYDAATGTLRTIQTVSTLPTGYTGTNSCADIHVGASGRWLYGSNRGHDSVAVFAIDSASGQLTPVGHQSTGGKTPRNFAIDPTGTLLLAANQNSDNVVVFKLDPDTGLPAPTGHSIAVPKPVCVKIVPVAD